MVRSRAVRLDGMLQLQKINAVSAAEQPEDEREKERDENAGGKGKVKGEVFPFEVDVTGKSPQPRNLPGKGEESADSGDNKTDDDE